MFFTAFFYISVIMKLSRAAVVISVSEETKFEVDKFKLLISFWECEERIIQKIFILGIQAKINKISPL